MSERREISSEKSEMSELVFASQMMREVISPPGSAASKSERIRNAALALRWKFSRARDVWYADERVSLKPSELRRIEEVSGIKYGQDELQEVNSLIDRATRIVERGDPRIDSALIAALRALVGALDRSGN